MSNSKNIYNKITLSYFKDNKMSFRLLDNINYLTDTEHGDKYRISIINCKLPRTPEIEYLDYKDILLTRINYMLGLVDNNREKALAELSQKGLPKIHAVQFFRLPDEIATEYTNSVCRTVIDLLRDKVIKELIVPIVQFCLGKIINDEVDLYHIMTWINRNLSTIFDENKQYIDIDEYGNVYVFANEDDICYFADSLYENFFGPTEIMNEE